MEQKPLYIKLNDYHKVLGLIEEMKHKLDSAKSTLETIKSLKQREEADINMWEKSIDELEKKIVFIDDNLTSSQ